MLASGTAQVFRPQGADVDYPLGAVVEEEIPKLANRATYGARFSPGASPALRSLCPIAHRQGAETHRVDWTRERSIAPA